MKSLLRFSQAVDALNAWVARSVAWLGLAAVLVCTVTATVRYAFNIGSNAWLELQWYLNAAVFLLVAGYTFNRNEHVRIDVISARLSARVQAWIEIVCSILFLLPTVLIIAWYSWPSLVNSIDVGEYSSDPGGLIRWPVRLLIPVAFSLLALQGISEIIKRVAFLRGLLPASTFDRKGQADVV